MEAAAACEAYAAGAPFATQDAALGQLLGDGEVQDGAPWGDGGLALAVDQPADLSVLDEPASISDVSDAEPLEPRAKRPDWRRKNREEIDRLRLEAAALSATAAALRKAACERSVDEDEDDGQACEKRRLPSAAALWKRIAQRQQAVRAASERENAKLRSQVSQRRKETRELRRAVLLRRANLQAIRDLLGFRWVPRTAKGGGGGSDDDARVFLSLRSEIDALYAELDTVLARSRVARLRCPDRAVAAKAAKAGGQIVWEFADAHAVPFDCAATARALWLAIGERSWQRQRGSDTQYMQPSASECMIRTRFRVVMPVLSISVLTRKVTKRFVERGRVVFVSNSVHQPFFNGKLSPRAAVFREVDRTVVYDATRSSSGSASRSEIRRLIIATTGGDGMAHVATEGPDWKAADRYSAGVDAWVWALSRDTQAVEDELLRGGGQLR